MKSIIVNESSIKEPLCIINSVQKEPAIQITNTKNEYQKLSRHLIYPNIKTIEEATLWAKNNLNIEHIDYADFDIIIANQFNRTLLLIQRILPEVLKNVKWLSTTQNYIDYIKQTKAWENWSNQIIHSNIDSQFKYEILKMYDKKYIDREKAYGEIQERFINGITFNKFWVSDYAKLIDSIRQQIINKNFPQGTAKVEAILIHEVSHWLHNFLCANNLDSFISDFWSTYLEKDAHFKSKPGCKLSTYAANSEGEFLAEAYTEYLLSQNPRKIATMVGVEVNRSITIYRNKTRGS